MFQNSFQNLYAALMGYNPQSPQNMFSPQIEPVQNLVCVNGAEFPAIRLFKFEELKQETAQEVKQDYISRQEFEDFKKELMENAVRIIYDL